MIYTKNLTIKPKFQKISDLEKLCERSSVDLSKTLEIVTDIEKNILKKGDEYISELTKKFDGVSLTNFRVSDEALKKAENQVDDDLKQSIDRAYENIWKFHESQKIASPSSRGIEGEQLIQSKDAALSPLTKERIKKIETSKGITCWQEFRAIERVGLYIPGGTAPLFSSVLMLAIPAQIAKCKRIVLCTPPNPAPEILYTAKKCGVTEIYEIGGAQAIFAMAHGTEQVPKVDKIFGPGNSFVTAAKMKVSAFTAIDMPAGPSEVLVMADENANAQFVAADLLSQAEHGIDSQSVLVCSSATKAEEIITETLTQVEALPRKDIAIESLRNSFAVIAESIDEMIEVSNTYAPEHLILQIENWEKILSKIVNAGSVFCGPYSCESAGDYASGTNHTLPTSGFARNYSGVNLLSYGKMITFQEVSKAGINDLGPDIMRMAKAEQLEGHSKAVEYRIKN